MQIAKKKTLERLDSFEETIVELCPLSEDVPDIAAKSVESEEEARERIAEARRVVADMTKVIDRAEAALA